MKYKEGLADQYVWSLTGRGATTSVGIQTRKLLREAFIAGYNASCDNLKILKLDEKEAGVGISSLARIRGWNALIDHLTEEKDNE